MVNCDQIIRGVSRDRSSGTGPEVDSVISVISVTQTSVSTLVRCGEVVMCRCSLRCVPRGSVVLSTSGQSIFLSVI